MAVNFGILDPNMPAKLAGSVYAGQQERQQNELAQQQAQMRQQLGTQQLETGRLQQQQSQMQMDQMIRDRDALAKLQQAFVANGKSPDLEANFDKMIRSGIQHFVDIGIKGKQKILEQKQFADIMGGGAAAPANALSPTQPAWEPAPGAVPIQQGLTPGTSVTTFDGSGTPTNALAPAPAQAPAAAPTNALAPKSDVAAMRSKRDRLLAMGTTQSIAAANALDADIKLASAPPVYHNVPGVGLVDPSTGRVVTPSVEKPAAPPSMVAEYTFAKTPEGGGYVGSFEKFVRDRAIAARPPGAPRPESAPVAVVDPATGKQVLVSREEALRGRMTPAAAMESISPKEIQKREAALPQATSAVQGFESKSDKFVADLMALRNHPGLSSITGIAAGRMPGLTADGRAAQALYDKVVAKGGFQALQDLRDASKTGGALGNVSNQEGKQLTASFAAIDRRQDAQDVQAAIDQAIADIQGTKTRMREAYDSTYSYKSGGTPATPAAAPGRPAAPARTQSGATTSNW